MKIKSLKQLKKLENKTIFLRVDYNVPLKNGKIEENFKILASLPTISRLLRRQAKIIIATHLGKPKKIEKKLSTKILAESLNKELKKIGFSNNTVTFQSEYAFDKIKKKIGEMPAGKILFLENLRFHPEEEKNDKKFSKNLASLADVYVNEAFAVCHRQHTSVAGIKKYLPAYAGLLLEKELINLNKVLKPKKPLVIIMGGAKLETKIPLLKKLYPKCNQILIGGALANNFLKNQKQEIGLSLFDEDSLKLSRKIKGKKIFLPIDVVVQDNRSKKTRIRQVENVKKGEKILDIGPETVKKYSNFIKKAQTIVWNGPMGKFEEKPFHHGTVMIGQAIASRASGKAFGLIGGGETVSAFKLTKMSEHIDWISTGGGAMLAYLGNPAQPGLKKIIY